MATDRLALLSMLFIKGFSLIGWLKQEVYMPLRTALIRVLHKFVAKWQRDPVFIKLVTERRDLLRSFTRQIDMRILAKLKIVRVHL